MATVGVKGLRLSQLIWQQRILSSCKLSGWHLERYSEKYSTYCLETQMTGTINCLCLCFAGSTVRNSLHDFLCNPNCGASISFN